MKTIRDIIKNGNNIFSKWKYLTIDKYGNIHIWQVKPVKSYRYKEWLFRNDTKNTYNRCVYMGNIFNDDHSNEELSDWDLAIWNISSFNLF